MLKKSEINLAQNKNSQKSLDEQMIHTSPTQW